MTAVVGRRFRVGCQTAVVDLAVVVADFACALCAAPGVAGAGVPAWIIAFNAGSLNTTLALDVRAIVWF